MIWIDRIEKAGRLVLWLTLASAVVLVPVIYIKQSQSAEEARKEELAKAKEEQVKAKEEAEKSDRLSVASLGMIITSLNESTAIGRVWFSNVSPRSGIVCLVGTATNPSTNMTSNSLGACQHIPAYASNVEMQVKFAGGDLSALCKGVSCSLSLKEMADVVPAPVALAN